ncbi:MAG: hypothetical protein DCC67_12035, partial [Planctomycetota bacterium]
MLERVSRLIHRLFASAEEGLRRTGDALLWPIERGVAAAARKMFRDQQGLESIEHWLVALARVLLWPVRLVWRLAAALAGLVVPASIRDAAGGISGRMAGRLVALAEWLNLDRAIGWLVWLAQPLWRPLAALGGFAFVWLSTRPYRRMAWGVPALVLLAPVAASAGWTLLRGRGLAVSHYQAAVREARSDQDYARVELLERKLAQLGADTRQLDFNTAVEVAQQGNVSAAYERMKALAPADRPGFPP